MKQLVTLFFLPFISLTATAQKRKKNWSMACTRNGVTIPSGIRETIFISTCTMEPILQCIKAKAADRPDLDTIYKRATGCIHSRTTITGSGLYQPETQQGHWAEFRPCQIRCNQWPEGKNHRHYWWQTRLMQTVSFDPVKFFHFEHTDKLTGFTSTTIQQHTLLNTKKQKGHFITYGWPGPTSISHVQISPGGDRFNNDFSGYNISGEGGARIYPS